MRLTFPDLDTLRLAIASGAVPDAVSRTPATAEFSPHGPIGVRTESPLSQKARRELERLGVRMDETGGEPLPERVLCWPQLLPLEAAPAAAFDDRLPVLFELDEPRWLSDVAAEMLRLGNDRQAIRFVSDGTQTRALLRVIGPPCYTLLRATDAPGNGNAGIRAYVEGGARVWVEMGVRHPLATRLKPPAGKLLLVRRPRDWRLFDDGNFQDIYRLTDFVLPDQAGTWEPVEVPLRIRVPLRLSPSDSTEPAELWVLSGDAQWQLEELVQSADDQLLSRLAFAVGHRGSETRIVLRARPAKTPPPVLVLDATPYRPHLKLSNLFVPCTSRLHPPLRRDVVESLLASDPQAITWLEPRAGSSFAPQSLPDAAFRPLSDWVDYVLDQEPEPLVEWMESMRFEFEAFECRDEIRPVAESPVPAAPESLPAAPPPVAVPPQSNLPEKTPGPHREKASPPPAIASPSPPDELRETLGRLEREMRMLSSPLEAGERHRVIWEEMAVVNSRLDRQNDAAICAGNALWMAEQPLPETLEFRLQAAPPAKAGTPAFWAWAGPETQAATFERILSQESVSVRDAQIMAASLIRSTFMADRPADLNQKIGRIARFLETHESLIGVRLLWLAWLAVFRLSPRDVLTLARARDRILERLFHGGLNPELDLPGFLRYSGAALNDRLRVVSEHVRRLHEAAQGWLRARAGGDGPPGETLAYADLMFAWAFALLGNSTESRRLQSQSALLTGDPVHQWLASGFGWRIEQALEYRAGGPLPESLLCEHAALENSPNHVRLKIDRLRECSRILEPSEHFNALRGAALSPLELEVALLELVVDPAQLLASLEGLLGRTDLSAQEEAKVLSAALERCPRLGQNFAHAVLDRVPLLLERGVTPLLEMELLERALLVAGTYDHPAHVRWLVDRLRGAIGRELGAQVEKQLVAVLQRSFAAMRRQGLRAEAAALLDEVAARVERTAYEPSRPGAYNDSQVIRLGQLLQLAGSWLSFGRQDRALPILDESRDVLLKGDLPPAFQTRLAVAYLAALGQAPIEMAVGRMHEVFQRVEHVSDGYITGSHYSRSQLSVVDAALTALFTEDVALDAAGRRWLDDDEYLIRRKIHSDVRAALEP